MPKTDITLPDATTIMAELSAIDSNSDYTEHFYPLIAVCGGQKRSPAEIALMLLMAIHNYTANKELEVVDALKENTNLYIDALVPDKIAAVETKAFWAKLCKGVIG